MIIPSELSINPNWFDSKNQKVVLYFQAWHSSGLYQHVRISGPGLPNGSICAVSDPKSPFGTQFLNSKVCLDYTKPFPNWIYQVSISYSKDGQEPMPPLDQSKIVTSSDVDVCGKMFSAVALSNDAGDDEDYNDTVVQISAFRDTTDC